MTNNTKPIITFKNSIISRKHMSAWREEEKLVKKNKREKNNVEQKSIPKTDEREESGALDK